VFLSKIKQETIERQDQYRVLAVQPTMIRILEAIVYDNIDKAKIFECQSQKQAGFTKSKSCATHLERIWEIIERASQEREEVTIASLDVKGAYDGIRHEQIEEHVRKWKRYGYYS